jgi:hypothetical protein
MDTLYYITYDLPIPYKGIKIYPATVKDYLYFMSYAQCLTLDKNSIPDVKIISMTELEYIFYSVKTEPYLFWFDKILSICLKEDKTFENLSESIKRYNYDEKGKPFFTIAGDRYNSKDFDEIKKIITMQNLIELPDETISKEVRDSLEKAKQYKDKLANVDTKPASYEDYLVSLSIVTGWTLDYIYSMSVRKMLKSIRRLDNLIHYKIYLSASMSGMVEFKDKSFIKHWLVGLDDDDKYKDVSLDMDAIQGKVSLESAKT